MAAKRLARGAAHDAPPLDQQRREAVAQFERAVTPVRGVLGELDGGLATQTLDDDQGLVDDALLELGQRADAIAGLRG